MPGWIAWPAGYALTIWGIDATYSLTEQWLKQVNPRVQDVAEGVRFLVPLALAFLIGLQLRTWWWVPSPFVATLVPMLSFSIVSYLQRPPVQRQQVAAGLIFGISAIVFQALAATLAAFAGVVIGRS